MADVVSIELLFDSETECAVRADWERLAAAGHSSLAAHRAPSNRPHLTLLARPAGRHAPRATAFAGAAALLPVTILLAEPIVFAHGDRGVLARRVVPTPELRMLQATVHSAAEARIREEIGTREGGFPAIRPPERRNPPESFHTSPGEWMPHVTLARRLRLSALDDALALLADPGEEGPPLAGVGEGLRHWDGSARVVTPIEPVAG